MTIETSELDFFLIDTAGNRRIPFKIQAEHGPYGYAIHPEGKSNDPKAARYTEDLKELVQAVVLHGKGVRAKVKAGPQKGQSNTVSLAKRNVRGYWLAKSKHEWIAGASIRPQNETEA